MKYSGGTIRKPGFHTNLTLSSPVKNILVSVNNDSSTYSYALIGKSHPVQSKEGNELEGKVILHIDEFKFQGFTVYFF